MNIKGLSEKFTAASTELKKFIYGSQHISSHDEKLSHITSSLPKLIAKNASDSKKLLINASTVGLGGFAGWLTGLLYTQSMSNLIIHECGHAAAAVSVYHTNPKISINALYWLLHGNWLNWFWGVREGAPGNWTSSPPGPLTPFGKLFSFEGRDLFICSAGLGVELIFNTTMAGLGLLAMRKKKKVLGASLLGFSAISHSAAHSYFRRYPQLLHKWHMPDSGGDPPQIAQELAHQLGISKVLAFRLLWYGYLFFPIIFLAFLFFLFANVSAGVPDECVLMRMLVENKSDEMKQILSEIEAEIHIPYKQIETLPEKEKEKILLHLIDQLLKKIKKHPVTNNSFKETKKVITKEIAPAYSFMFRLRQITALIGFVAFGMRDLGLSNVSVFMQAFYFLSGMFLLGQSICLFFDVMQTVKDLANTKLSNTMKAISVARTLLSVVSLVVMSATLFFLHASGVWFYVFIAISITQIALFFFQQKIYPFRFKN